MKAPSEGSPSHAAKPHAQRTVYIACRAINNRAMKRLSGTWTIRRILNKPSRRFERTTASVLLAIGAAALIGWLVTQLYVAAVTLD